MVAGCRPAGIGAADPLKDNCSRRVATPRRFSAIASRAPGHRPASAARFSSAGLIKSNTKTEDCAAARTERRVGTLRALWPAPRTTIASGADQGDSPRSHAGPLVTTWATMAVTRRHMLERPTLLDSTQFLREVADAPCAGSARRRPHEVTNLQSNSIRLKEPHGDQNHAIESETDQSRDSCCCRAVHRGSLWPGIGRAAAERCRRRRRDRQLRRALGARRQRGSCSASQSGGSSLAPRGQRNSTRPWWTRTVPVKVRVDHLAPGKTYYYQATDAAGNSSTGRFKTSPKACANTAVRFGVWETGAANWRLIRRSGMFRNAI